MGPQRAALTYTEELVNEAGLWHHFPPCIHHGRVQRRPGHLRPSRGLPASASQLPYLRPVQVRSLQQTCNQVQAQCTLKNCSHQAIIWPCSQASQAHVPLPRTACSLGQHTRPRHSAAAPRRVQVRRSELLLMPGVVPPGLGCCLAPWSLLSRAPVPASYMPARRKCLATVPLVQACLRQCTVLRGRRFKASRASFFHASANSTSSKCFAHTMSEPVLQAGQHAELDAALEAAASAAAPVYVLFPGAGAVSVSEAARASEHRRCLEQASLPVVDARSGPHAAASPGELRRGAGVPDHGCCPPEALESDTNCNGAADAVAPGTLSLPAPAHAAESRPARGSRPAYWLIALDGTWQQANEMFQVPPLLGQGCLHICREHASLAL